MSAPTPDCQRCTVAGVSCVSTCRLIKDVTMVLNPVAAVQTVPQVRDPEVTTRTNVHVPIQRRLLGVHFARATWTQHRLRRCAYSNLCQWPVMAADIHGEYGASETLGATLEHHCLRRRCVSGRSAAYHVNNTGSNGHPGTKT